MTYLYIACIGKHSLSLAALFTIMHPHISSMRMVTWTYPVLGDSVLDAGSDPEYDINNDGWYD